MFSVRDFWRRHRRKIFVSVGVFGSGYLLYKLYDAHRRRLDDLERELAVQRENEELIKAQMQAHFESIQRIADTTTLPHSMLYLSGRIAEELDLSHLTERLMKGKGQPNTLTPSEKLELWDRLKILSFTRMVLSLWAMTMLSLYIRVQVNILGRHLYIDTARGGGSSHLLEEADPIDRHDQQKFLASADFLSNYSIPALISNMHAAAAEVLKGKQLRDVFNSMVLHGTIMQILDLFISTGKPHNLVDYLMPDDTKSYKPASPSNGDSSTPADVTKFDQLMVETRAVLSSAEFINVIDVSLRTVVDAVVEDMMGSAGGGSPSSGMVLAKLLPRVAQMGPLLLEEPSKNRFIQIIQKAPEVEFFFTLLYANMPTL
ncbi:LOW QUALITY PROTEIN: peroxisome biogenesis protein 3-2-like [Vitis riparia]|uniref:LOW QUALITY PROTEIN: peroxisome biogenesis protein 3-2-like n=1 Tax=Vitis riparia TaxID=96939 RepID=UPI00155A12D4|nr:LOW QUALITY PROTEIN: peroxisome biogenesis protein 3-2-like [Vitis riparia]